MPSGLLATRKPLLLFLLPGLFLLRLAPRRFVSLLFHEPPRTTRDEPTSGPSGFRIPSPQPA